MVKCSDCQEEVSPQTNGVTYRLCSVCWKTNNREFWRNKSNKRCLACKEMKSLDLWKRDKDGVPYKHCIECSEKKPVQMAGTCVDCKAEISQPKTGKVYKQCSACNLKSSIEFWSKAKNKKCGFCKEMRAIEMYDKKENGIPHWEF